MLLMDINDICHVNVSQQICQGKSLLCEMRNKFLLAWKLWAMFNLNFYPKMVAN